MLAVRPQCLPHPSPRPLLTFSTVGNFQVPPTCQLQLNSEPSFRHSELYDPTFKCLHSMFADGRKGVCQFYSDEVQCHHGVGSALKDTEPFRSTTGNLYSNYQRGGRFLPRSRSAGILDCPASRKRRRQIMSIVQASYLVWESPGLWYLLW